MTKEASWVHLKMICQDDAACVEKFRAVMQKELPTELAGLKAALTAQDLTVAAELVHKIKHKFSLVKMHSAYAYAVGYEEALRSGDNSGEGGFEDYLEELVGFLEMKV